MYGGEAKRGKDGEGESGDFDARLPLAEERFEAPPSFPFTPSFPPSSPSRSPGDAQILFLVWYGTYVLLGTQFMKSTLHQFPSCSYEEYYLSFVLYVSLLRMARFCSMCNSYRA